MNLNQKLNFINILMVGPDPNTRGGITSVINAYNKSLLWKQYKIIWISTYNDKNHLYKIYYFFSGIFKYVTNLKKARIIHIHLSEPVSALRKTFFFIIGKIFLKPIIIHFHSFDSKTSIGSKFGYINFFLIMLKKSLYYHLFGKMKFALIFQIVKLKLSSILHHLFKLRTI
jgi:hypothetical protein